MRHEADNPMHQDRPQPLRLSTWFAVFAVFLGLLGQSLHVHPVSFVRSAQAQVSYSSTATPDDNPDLCPLCTAMHSAKPAVRVDTVVLSPALSMLARIVFAPFVPSAPLIVHFSRPPPSFSV